MLCLSGCQENVFEAVMCLEFDYTLHNCSPCLLHLLWLCCRSHAYMPDLYHIVSFINHINSKCLFNDILEAYTTNTIQNLIMTSSWDDRLEHSLGSSRDSGPVVAGRNFMCSNITVISLHLTCQQAQLVCGGKQEALKPVHQSCSTSSSLLYPQVGKSCTVSASLPVFKSIGSKVNGPRKSSEPINSFYEFLHLH